MGEILDVLELGPIDLIGGYQGFDFPIPPLLDEGGTPSAASAPPARGGLSHAASDGVHTLSF